MQGWQKRIRHGWLQLAPYAAVLGIALAALPALAAGPNETPCLAPRPISVGDSPTLRIVGSPRAWKASDTGVPLNLRAFLARGARQGRDETSVDFALTRLTLESAFDIAGGRPQEARAGIDKCLAMARQARDRPVEAACTNNLGVLLAAQGLYADAQEQLQSAGRLFSSWAQTPAPYRKEPGATAVDWTTPEDDLRSAQAGYELSVSNLGNVALALGLLNEAERHFQAGLQRQANAACVPAAAGADLFRLYQLLGRQEDAQRIRQSIPRAFDARALAKGSDYFDFDAVSLNSSGLGLTLRGPAPQPGQAVAQTRETLGVGTAASLSETLATALAAESRASHALALATFGQLARAARASQRAEIEVTAHAGLMRIHAAMGSLNAATYHGKRAVNSIVSIRSNLFDRNLPPAVRRSYLRERQFVFAQLTQMLIDQKRLAEAEWSLQILKEDEDRQYLPEKPSKLGGVPLSSAEQAVEARFEQASARLRALQTQRSEIGTASIFGTMALNADLRGLECKRFELVDSVRPGLQALKTLGPERVGNMSLPLELKDDFLDLTRNDGAGLRGLLGRLRSDAADFRAGPPSAAQLRELDAAITMTPELGSVLRPMVESLPTRQLRSFGDAFARGGASTPAPRSAGTSIAPPGPCPARSVTNAIMGDIPQAAIYERLWRIEKQLVALEQQQQAMDAALPRQLPAGPAAEAPDISKSPAVLAAKSPKSVLLYYLPSDQRLDILLVSANGRKSWTLPLNRTELEAKIDRFVSAVRDPKSDPIPSAQALYQQILQPLAPELASANHVALALSGHLRLVPFSALNDNGTWLAERFSFALSQGASLQDSLRPVSRQWRVAALGASEGGQGLSKLPGVRQELESIVRDDKDARASVRATASGALPGRRWMDRQFNAQALRAATDSGAQVLHIASHFKFVPHDIDASFLLLGDGSPLSLRALSGADFKFDRIELVTLSACQTGISETDAYGQEVDGLGALIIGKGAPAVLASLWVVSDTSTATLMSNLYRDRASTGASVAQALQRAQQNQLQAAARDGVSGLAGLPARGAVPMDAQGRPVQPVAGESRLGGAHPYYWAPFVLMGNWL